MTDAYAYTKWIEEHYGTRLKALAMCSVATDQMVLAFPELKRVRGHCNGAEHWWCLSPDGSVVDPTSLQYTPPLKYVALDESVEQPVGYCANKPWCRSPIFKEQREKHSCCCSDGCRKERQEEQEEQEAELAECNAAIRGAR